MSTSIFPWQRFRCNNAQNGRATLKIKLPSVTWHQAPEPQNPSTPGNAARGIFNSAVIDQLDRAWSGNAGAQLWIVTPDGRRTIQKLCGLVDTTPLLLDNALYLSCGDGWIWRAQIDKPDHPPQPWFQAAQPSDAFINWFEGHLGLDASNRIVAPCDNKRVYLVETERDARSDTCLQPNNAPCTTLPPRFWDFPMLDQSWSLACCNPAGWLFFGNNAMRPTSLPSDVPCPNIYGVGPDLRIHWTYETKGSVVASPMWGQHNWLYVGSFDGTLYAFDCSKADFSNLLAPGLPSSPAWIFTTRDHLYSSPAELSDGTIIQAGVDGSVYALHPLTGELLWQHDNALLNPFRSSPAVTYDKGNDLIYLGTGDGCLLVLNSKGNIVQQLQLVPEEIGPRKAINASPAISPHGVVIGDSEGWLHQLAWGDLDTNLVEHQNQPTSDWGSGLSARLLYTDVWGVNHDCSQLSAYAWQSLCFTLDSRLGLTNKNLRPVLGLIESVKVQSDSSYEWEISLSGDRRYVLLWPKSQLNTGDTISLNLSVTWLTEPQRDGLRMSAGRKAGSFEHRIQLRVDGAPAPVEPPKSLCFQRVTVPLPTLMPSYNQIGFETLVYSIGYVQPIGSAQHLYWLIGCKSDGAADSATHVRFPMIGSYDALSGAFSLDSRHIFSELNGFRTKMEWFGLACRLDPQGKPLSSPSPSMRWRYLPSAIEFYGSFLEGLGMGGPNRPIEALGSGDLRVASPLPTPNVQNVQAQIKSDGVEVKFTFTDRERIGRTCLSILLVDTACNMPVQTDYAYSLSSKFGEYDGTLCLVRPNDPAVNWPAPGQLRVWLMLNTTAVEATMSKES